jgi:hypothetical protein
MPEYQKADDYCPRSYRPQRIHRFMNSPQMQVDIRSFTINDIDVGSRLYAALVVEARNGAGTPVYYSDLLDRARALFRDDQVLGRAVPIGIGPKLLFVKEFCSAHGYPNLACLAVSRADDLPGKSYQGNWHAEMEAVRAFDWETATPELDSYAAAGRAAAMPLEKVKPLLAAERFYAFYKAHSGYRNRISEEEKQEITNLIIEGYPEATAFERVKN